MKSGASVAIAKIVEILPSDPKYLFMPKEHRFYITISVSETLDKNHSDSDSDEIDFSQEAQNLPHTEHRFDLSIVYSNTNDLPDLFV